MTILVAVPIRAVQVEHWTGHITSLFNSLTYADKELALWPNDIPDTGRRYEPNALARNGLIENCLRPHHSHVLWLDVDLVRVPPDLIERLMAVSATGIVGALPYVEEPGGWFYDTGGFVKDGAYAAPRGPIFPGYAGGVLELDSVGTCYLAPADIYRAGLRYRVTGDEVEHRSLCAAARALGYRVWATDAAIVRHAYLPNHGLKWTTNDTPPG